MLVCGLGAKDKKKLWILLSRLLRTVIYVSFIFLLGWRHCVTNWYLLGIILVTHVFNYLDIMTDSETVNYLKLS